MNIKRIGFGGGCHWCTEAYFQSLIGVEKVEQGWISATAPNEAFSEAVIVHYNPIEISLPILIAVHLHSHAATKTHSFREKYRSAVYVFTDEIENVKEMIKENQIDFEALIITQVLSFENFKLNSEKQLNYYIKNKKGVFCERYITPKLQLIESKYSRYFREI